MKVWIDGEIVDGAEARISVLDHGFLYGDGVFEGIRMYGRSVFRLDDHLRRLATGARALGLELPFPLAKIRKIVLDTCRAFAQDDRDDCYVRLIVTRGVGALGVDPTTCSAPQVICIAAAIQLYPEEKLRDGIRLVTSSFRRPAADVLDPRIKSLNYLNSVLAKAEAKARGADEALILNAAGLVAEASVANVFAVRDGVLSTPPVTSGALEGVTRASILEIATAEGIVARERELGRFDLFAADEVFLTGTGARVVSVASLDDQAIGEAAPGGGGRLRPMTDLLASKFGEYVVGRGVPV